MFSNESKLWINFVQICRAFCFSNCVSDFRSVIFRQIIVLSSILLIRRASSTWRSKDGNSGFWAAVFWMVEIIDFCFDLFDLICFYLNIWRRFCLDGALQGDRVGRGGACFCWNAWLDLLETNRSIKPHTKQFFYGEQPEP